MPRSNGVIWILTRHPIIRFYESHSPTSATPSSFPTTATTLAPLAWQCACHGETWIYVWSRYHTTVGRASNSRGYTVEAGYRTGAWLSHVCVSPSTQESGRLPLCTVPMPSVIPTQLPSLNPTSSFPRYHIINPLLYVQQERHRVD